MVSYTIDIDKFSPYLADLIGKIDPYQWMQAYLYAAVESFKYGTKVEGEGNPIFPDAPKDEQFIASARASMKILTKYPVLFIDPVLDNLINDTIPNIHSIYLPYNAYFINKVFKYEDGIFMGISVYNITEFVYEDLLENLGTVELAKEALATISGLPGLDNDLPECSFETVYIDLKTRKLSYIIAGSDEVYTRKNISKDFHVMLKKIMEYGLNVANLLTSRADLKNPTNPKKDIRVVPHYTSYNKKSREKSRFSIVRVFGTLKDYTESYNKEKRRHGKSLDQAIFVSGHWREFRHERYKKMRGEKIFIPPYMKGMDKTLYQKLVQLTYSHS
jgi:hypothetical protein